MRKTRAPPNYIATKKPLERSCAERMFSVPNRHCILGTVSPFLLFGSAPQAESPVLHMAGGFAVTSVARR